MSVPSLAAQVIISIIPIVGIVMASVVAFFYLLWSHREKLAQIERGSYQPKRIDLETFSLLTGLLLTCVGIVLCIFFVILDGLSYGLLGGAIPLAVGASLLAFFFLHRGRSGA
ncbi:MAG TPA: DUF6249 domain-containing protein [Rectinemataceae bacterium]|nr:DUF6249 domain-containing protein [Rectinemataceae bacterium]